MIPFKILFVVTSAATMGDGGEPTGLWFEELATPYYAFVDQGADVDIVSTAGGAVPIDPRSKKPKGENPASVDRFMEDTAASAKIVAWKRIVIAMSSRRSNATTPSKLTSASNTLRSIVSLSRRATR